MGGNQGLSVTGIFSFGPKSLAGHCDMKMWDTEKTVVFHSQVQCYYLSVFHFYTLSSSKVSDTEEATRQ